MINREKVVRMKYELQWDSEEEGHLIFLEKATEWLYFDIFMIGEEAELVINGGEIVDKVRQSEILSGKLLEQLRKCIKKAFSLLWNEGIEEVFLVEKQGDLFIKRLKEENVIELVYSEYMMKRKFSIKDIYKESEITLEIIEEEDSFICENKEKSFFCRLLPYQGESEFYLYEVQVVEHLRNQGIATKCLKQLYSDLVKKSGEKKEVTVYLQVGSYNKPAVHLYQKLGFELSEEICYNTIKQ